MQLELGRDEGCGKLGIGGGTGTGTPDLRGDVMKLLAVLVGDDRAARSSGIGSDLHNTLDGGSDNGEEGLTDQTGRGRGGSLPQRRRRICSRRW